MSDNSLVLQLLKSLLLTAKDKHHAFMYSMMLDLYNKGN